jgi:2-polyprenyl-3-methyl-5-hydroxy-6-metoxy-1,4-benzoquinol methylase
MEHGEYSKRHKRRLLKTLQFLNVSKCNDILDLGCYPGDFGVLLRKQYPDSHITLADIEVSPIADHGLNFVKIENLEHGKLPFSDNCFDLVICLEVLEHLYNPDNLLKEIHRVLISGGILVMSTPNMGCWINRLLLLFGYYPAGMSISIQTSLEGASDLIKRQPQNTIEEAKFDYHCKLYTFGAIKALFKVHNFNIVRIKGYYGVQSPSQNFMIRAVHILFERTLSSMAQFILVMAKAIK